MFSRGRPQAHFVFVVRHGTVSADVDPIEFGVAHDHQIIGADVTATIQLMQQRNGELENVDVFVPVDIFQNRTGLDDAWWNGFVLTHAVSISLHHIHRSIGYWKAQCQSQSC